jgi:hypothetical protein
MKNDSFVISHLAPRALAMVLAMTGGAALAAPGAHGPDGEHLDQPGGMRAQGAAPRVVANSEAFELVAEYRDRQLTIIVDRYETNEPVLDAKLSVEVGNAQAPATFRAAQGDYVVTAPQIVDALATPGQHALVFTLAAGSESDLLDGVLVTANAESGSHARSGTLADSGPPPRPVAIGTILFALCTAGLAVWWWRRRRRPNTAVAEGAP